MTGSRLSLDVRVDALPYLKPFRISGHTFTESQALVATLSDGNHTGRGEAAGVFYLGDDPPAMLRAIESVRQEVEGGVTREGLQSILPPGGARNALDCAYWELEASRAGRPVWELAGVPDPRPLVTTFTLGADDPATMAEGARAWSEARQLKLKLTGEFELDARRVEAVRAARPECWIGVDANQGYAIEGLAALVDMLAANAVELLEQPLRRGHERDLEGFDSPIPIAADESVLALADVAGLAGRFDVVNIKLDKCGGLTEALAMASRAREMGLGVMVGNMMGSSWAMGPAFVLGQVCDIVDLDGPTFLATDRAPGVAYSNGAVSCSGEVWGGG